MSTERKKVLLVATVQSHIGQFHKPLMKLLKENGWEIHVAARNNLAEKDTLSLDYPDKVFDIHFQRSPFKLSNINAYRQLKQLLKEQKYDVVHCNTPVGGILGRLAARRYRKEGTKVFYTAHGFHFYKGAPWINWLLYYPIEKLIARWTDKLITVNWEDFSFASQRMPCPVYHIHGVGVDSLRYHMVSEEEKETKRADLGLKGTVLLSAGELLPNKNQKTAILALNEVRKKIPDTYLFIAGNGPERSFLEQLACQLGIEDYVVFLGYTTKLPVYMQSCDAFISCSFREGLGMNILEALACGKPVIASDNRGHRELIQTGINGYLVKPSDHIETANAILKAIQMTSYQSVGVSELIQAYTDISVQKELKAIYELTGSREI